MSELGPKARRWLGRGVAGLHVVPVAITLLCIGSLALPTIAPSDGPWFGPWRTVYGEPRERWGHLLAASGATLLTALAVNFAVGVPLSVLIFRVDFAGRHAAMTLLVAAAFTPFHLASSALIDVIGVEPLRASAWGLGAVHGIAFVPWTALFAGVALLSVPRSLEEAARLEGASPFGAFLRIAPRYALSGLGAGATLLTVSVLTDYAASDLVQVRTFAEELYTSFARHRRPAEPSLVALPAAIVCAPLLLAFSRYLLGVRDLAATRVPRPDARYRSLPAAREPRRDRVLRASDRSARRVHGEATESLEVAPRVHRNLHARVDDDAVDRRGGGARSARSYRSGWRDGSAVAIRATVRSPAQGDCAGRGLSRTSPWRSAFPAPCTRSPSSSGSAASRRSVPSTTHRGFSSCSTSFASSRSRYS